jgi:hypothetical protein
MLISKTDKPICGHKESSQAEDAMTGQSEYVLVPREPTPAMLKAGWYEAHDEDAEGVWRVMIEAYELATKDDGKMKLSPQYPGNVESLILMLQEILRDHGNLDVVMERYAHAREPLEVDITDDGTPFLLFR